MFGLGLISKLKMELLLTSSLVARPNTRGAEGFDKTIKYFPFFLNPNCKLVCVAYGPLTRTFTLYIESNKKTCNIDF